MKVILINGPHQGRRVDLKRLGISVNEDGTIFSIDRYPLVDADKLSQGLDGYEVGKSDYNHKYRLNGNKQIIDGDEYHVMDFVETIEQQILFNNE